MPYVAGIGHRLLLQDLLDNFSFEDLEEAEAALQEVGITIFSNDSDVFLVNSDKYKIIDEDKYVDLKFELTQEEESILTTYAGQFNKRIKLFWFTPTNDEIPFDMLNVFTEQIDSEESDSFDD